LVLVAALFVLCTACKVTLNVGVDAHADGSGVVRVVVTLDQDAAARLHAAGGQLAADDLRKAGWTVATETGAKDGHEDLTATKPFNTPRELTAVMAEVAGPRQAFKDFKLTRRRSFARTRTGFSGVVNLTGGPAVFGDDRLKQQTGADLGVDVAELERQAGEAVDKFLSVQVAVRLPGKVSANAPSKAGNGAVWHPTMGELAALSASGSQLDMRRVVLLPLAGLAAAAAVVLVRRRRRVPRD
jgi:hypothetical protein